MFDNLCKFLAETFPEDLATWLLGNPITLTQLSPTELFNEPIRADSLILLQSPDRVLHIEFQTNPDETMPFRMLDYWVRIRRRFPNKTIYQVVIYLRPSNSPLVYQGNFEGETTIHEFQVIRLWEQPKEIFFSAPGLLPFAVLSDSENREEVLREVSQAVEMIEDKGVRSNLAAASEILAGLVLKAEVVESFFRSELMRESVIYQKILEEG
ncbi:Rpn family recombination-promoting nuclease/putative transposase, partial [Spirulina subsalsa]|uniref:Rpn family recombination-promoting nuclease/putative transposase n=1 Tax=Spirulina subsalsa TaxID=54311 RepID=UPI0038B2A0BE